MVAERLWASYAGYSICLLSLLIAVWSFYPGLMTADSVAALDQGRANNYGDTNAPVMSWLWGRLDSITPGPSLIFVMHLTIYWIAAALFWRTTHGRSVWLGLALVLTGVLPHILGVAVVVWKDVALGVGLFLSVALVYFAQTRRSRLALFISPLFLFYGYTARLNAFLAVLPIAIWTGFVALEIFGVEKKRLIGIIVGSCYFVVLSLAVYAVNGSLTQGRTDYPFQQIYLYDLAALSVERNESLFPQHIHSDPDFSMKAIRERYNERSVSDLIFPNIPHPGDRPPMKWTNDLSQVEELRYAWQRSIAEDPLAYFRHRARVFVQLIGLRRSVTDPFVVKGFESNPPEFRVEDNPGHMILMKYLRMFQRPAPQSLFHRAVVWMAICGMLLVTAVKRRFRGDWQLVFVLSSSSVLYVAGYFPTTPSTEFRYLFWPAIASAVAVIFGIYLWKSEKSLDQ